jgi:nucleoside-diphosphate-sugar epimerase
MRLRIVVLGGTRFIGRAIVDELVAGGHDVLVVHRGTQPEPPGLPDVPHLHGDRLDLAPLRSEIEGFGPDALLDCAAFGATDADAVLGAFPEGRVERLVVLSSMDTYRAYGSLHAGTVTDAVPLDETSPVRTQRFPYRGQMPGMDDYEKLEVEERWLGRGATVARLPMVFGEHDYQRREEFVLRRVRAGRKEIPVGAGTALLTFGYVGDVARGIRLVLEADPAAVSGEVFNFGERRSPTMRLRAEHILAACGEVAAGTELVPVPDDALPPDLGILGTVPQPLLVSSEKARRVLGWEESDPDEARRRSVQWHLAHPPAPVEGGQAGSGDFSADDAALERRLESTSDATP